MFKNGMQILAEMAKCDNRDHTVEDLETKMAQMKFSDVLCDMQKVTANEIVTTKEAVRVRECKRLDAYLVEMEDITRFMRDSNVRNFKEAIGILAEHYDLDKEKFAIVVDEEAINDMVYEAKCAAKCSDKKYAKAKLETVMGLQSAWDIIGSQGVRLVKM